MKVSSAGLHGARVGQHAAAGVVALQPAVSLARPVPRSPRLADGRAAVRVAALATGPLRGVSAPRAGSSGDAPAARAPHTGVTRSAALVWLGAGLLLSAALLLVGVAALRDLLAGWQASAWPAVEEPLGDADAPRVPQPEPTPNAQVLAEAINAELRRAGVGVHVELADDGTATVSGRLASPQDRDRLLDWLQAVPGVGDIDDRIEVEPEPTLVPRPAAPAPLPSPAAPRLERPRQAAPAVPAPRPAALPLPANEASVLPPPTARPEPAEAPAPPDADTIERKLRRELARLALPDITAEVDPATLQITLRGRTHDAARKAQALAAARAALPGARVRDLVFLVEE
jgi:LPXTG-motif cell wall-anchored protein